MKTPLKLISFSGLALMLAASCLVFAGRIDAKTYHILAILGTAAWFGTVPFWMRRRLHQH